MREIRIYQPGLYQQDKIMELSPEASHHVAVVLRKQPGAELTLFNGENWECGALITVVKKKQVLVSLTHPQEINKESPLAIHLGQAISKGDRMELVMQKAVELGVASITPLWTQRSVVKLEQERLVKKIQQWQAIAISACEQSGRNTVPKINQPLTLEQYLLQQQASLKLILHTEGNKTWRHYAINQASIALIIGPEGGLTDEEVTLACQMGYFPLSLGPRILRTETAAISALSILQAVGGDL